MKRNTLIIIILILLVVGIIYRKKIMAFFTGATAPVSTGTVPTVRSFGAELTQADIDCGGLGSPTDVVSRIIENCTKPKYRVVGTAKQKSFRFCPEADCDLNLDACVSEIKTPDGKSWYFNYQSGDKCIYIDNTDYAF